MAKELNEMIASELLQIATRLQAIAKVLGEQTAEAKDDAKTKTPGVKKERKVREAKYIQF